MSERLLPVFADARPPGDLLPPGGRAYIFNEKLMNAACAPACPGDGGRQSFLPEEHAMSLLRSPLVAALAVGGLTASTASAAPSSCGGSGSVTTVNGKLADGAT